MAVSAQTAVFNLSCAPHALPFRTIFTEHALRHRSAWGALLLQRMLAAGLVHEDELPSFGADRAAMRLEALLEEQETAYVQLADAKNKPEFSHYLVSELEAACYKADLPLKRLLHAMDASALCFSGGGIRSASFCLGVLEGLARFSTGRLLPGRQEASPSGLLLDLDYFSTVSGGGYIGSWWTAWIYRLWAANPELRVAHRHLLEAEKEVDRIRSEAIPQKGDAGVPDPEYQQKLQKATEAKAAKQQECEQLETETWRESFSSVVEALSGAGKATSGDPEPRPARHLRDYTSYLAPALGLTLDTWALASIVLRNLIVTWAMIAPLLLVAVTVPQVSRFLMWAVRPYAMHWHWPVMIPVLAALFAAAAFTAGKFLPSHRDADKCGLNAKRVFFFFVGPLFVASWILVLWWWSRMDHPLSIHQGGLVLGLRLIAFVGFAVLGTSTLKSYAARVKQRNLKRSLLNRPFFVAIIMLLASVLMAMGTAWAVEWLHVSLFPWLYQPKGGHLIVRLGSEGSLFILLAIPLIWTVLLVASSLFSGLLGIYELEEDREWYARSGGLMLVLMAGWISAHAIAMYGHFAWQWILTSGLTLGGLGSGLGWSGATAAGPRPVKVEQMGVLGRFFSKHNLVLPSLCLLALLLVTLGMATLEEQLRAALGTALHFAPYCGDLRTSLIILGGASVLALVANSAINVNLFSLHEMYRMRLMRAFLGASNTAREPDAFTGFDPRDTPYMRELPLAPGVPMHIINTTLNLVGTSELAWRQRKAESFSLSPVCCGGWRLGYVPTGTYGGSEGLTLATAMAISGAAFNPNMGYNSSPLVTLMMTLFNVRLGWWLPNPGRQADPSVPWAAKGEVFLRKTGPTLALAPLLLEAFGKTDVRYRWIELSDGGHFENLGLYEMVLRRCHSIVVVDAGADPKCQFEDLGNALRKIQIDLGIPIRFPENMKMKAEAHHHNRYCAVATIDYACVDGECVTEADRAGLNGRLIYIKAGLTGREPPDVKQYSLTHLDFPHETTANQFFNESQFESYRHLGSFVVDSIGKAAPPAPKAEEGAPPPVPIGTGFDAFEALAKSYADAKD